MDVTSIAKLANLTLTPSELTQLETGLNQVLELVNHIRELNTVGIEPTSQVTGLTNVTRDDEIDQSRVLTQAQAISNSQSVHNGYFEVNAIFQDQ
jgi:aspartyl-tRNA(Asn)/glutamyl-tRNA(Gln) amidotransferase subunit C